MAKKPTKESEYSRPEAKTAEDQGKLGKSSKQIVQEKETSGRLVQISQTGGVDYIQSYSLKTTVRYG